MNTQISTTYGQEADVTRWLKAIDERGNPAERTEAHELAVRIVRRINFLRRAARGSQDWAEVELDVLRRRLAVLAGPTPKGEVSA